MPKRGDVLWLTLSPTEGHEQSGRRPVVVLSPASYNEKTGLALISPLTSREKGYPFEVKVPPTDDFTGVILADQVRCIDWRARRAEFATTLPPAVVAEALAKLGALIT